MKYVPFLFLFVFSSYSTINSQISETKPILSIDLDTTRVEYVPTILADGDASSLLVLHRSPVSADAPQFKMFYESKSSTSPPYAKFILPSALMSYGILVHMIDPLRDIDFEIHKGIKKNYEGQLHFDDYLQFAPAVGVYGCEFVGIDAKNNFRDRTFILVSSYLMMGAMVHTGKTYAGVNRPDSPSVNSFPSGHTAAAFVGAHILHKEYKDSNKWVSVGGYTAASLTGVMRMVNKRHWLSDVIAGAGVGLLSVELSYLLLPYFQKIMGDGGKQKSLVVVPSYNGESLSLGMAYTF